MLGLDTSAPDTGTRGRIAYIPALDGIRAIAVVAVLLYHGGVSWLPGGFLGVDTFFVLSGYLITALLVAEWRQTGRISLVRFWTRRARRLLPAVGGVVVAVSAIAAVRSEFGRLWDEIVAVALYVYNWLLVGEDVSYFETMGRPSPLRHMWSLAVEEQFYLVWPLIVVGVLVWLPARRGIGRVRRLLAAALGGAVVSASIMAILFDPATDPSRVYFGTDTRVGGLLLGAAGAIVWRPGGSATRPRPLGAALGWIGLAGTALGFWLVDETAPALYRGGFVVVSLMALMLVVGVVDHRTTLARALAVAPLRWAGTRSYSIYLWHWPVMTYLRPGVDVQLDRPRTIVLQLLVTGVLAEASYRLVESPWRRTRQARGSFRWRVGSGRIPLLPVVTVTGLVVGAAAFIAVDTRPPPIRPLEFQVGESEVFAVSDTWPPPSAVTVPSLPPTTSTTEPATTTTSQSVETTVPPVVDPPRVSAIGDSVMVGAVDELEAVYPGRITIDAELGRTVAQGVDRIERMARWGRLREVVVVHLGNNGPIGDDDIDRIMTAAGPDRRVIFVTVRLPQRWEDTVNSVLRSAVAERPNARLVDWQVASSGRSDWFAGDGVHVVFTPGADAYAELITAAVLEG